METIELPNGTRACRSKIWLVIAAAKRKYDVAHCGKQILDSLPPEEERLLRAWAMQQCAADGSRDYHIWCAAPLLYASATLKPRSANEPPDLFYRIQAAKSGKGVIF